MMRKIILVAVGVAVLVALAALQASAVTFEKYRVVEEVTLKDVTDVFIIPIFLFPWGINFLPSGELEGIRAIQAWNPDIGIWGWDQKIPVGTVLNLPAEWCLRGIQGIVEHATPPQLNRNPVAGSGEDFWFLILLGIGLALVFVVFWGRLCIRPCQPWHKY